MCFLSLVQIVKIVKKHNLLKVLQADKHVKISYLDSLEITLIG